MFGFVGDVLVRITNDNVFFPTNIGNLSDTSEVFSCALSLNFSLIPTSSFYLTMEGEDIVTSTPGCYLADSSAMLVGSW